MIQPVNSLGQPIGFPLPDWQARPRPPRTPMEGRFCRLEPLDPERHGVDLFAANGADKDRRNWTYLPYGPFERLEDYRAHLQQACRGDDPFFHAVIDRGSGKPIGCPK